MPQKLFKLGCLKDDTEVEYSHPAHFDINGRRIVATAADNGDTVFRRLAQHLEPPLFLLYVLHTPRGEGEPGRYQSTPISGVELNSFLDHFSDFLSSDARFDLWVYSPAQQATVVWDRHNLIFAYGPLKDFESYLLTLGFSRGMPSADFEHLHHYHPEFDSAATEILKHFNWSQAPLRPEDEQFTDRD